MSNADFQCAVNRCRSFRIITLTIPAHKTHTPQPYGRDLFVSIA
jgi:hypothetical protein